MFLRLKKQQMYISSMHLLKQWYLEIKILKYMGQ